MVSFSDLGEMGDYSVVTLYIGWKSRSSVPTLVNKYLEGSLKVDEFITHTMPLLEINRAFELMHQGKRLVISSL